MSSVSSPSVRPDARATRTPAAATGSGKRLDLQGLRALAVGLVVLNHAFDWPAGGFVGVDIFFVISGFLMTSVLHREFEKHGRIRFLAFYRRRIRRLIPASVAVLAVTVAAAWMLFSSGRFISTLWDALASLFFVSNWRFASQQTDYFAQGRLTSPLQHYWSLSLEEQYYLVWPLAILLIALLAARVGRPRVFAAAITLALTVGLFVVSLHLTQADSGTAYFITPARLWELSVGSSVALCMPWFSKMPSALRPAFALLSLAGMIAAGVITPSGGGFPAPWAALAVLSTAVFIAFPWTPARSWLNPLANPILTYVGDISYSLYLWHFPALIFATELATGTPDEGTPVPAAVSIVVSVVLASLSFRLIEEPVRASSWLEPRRQTREQRLRRLRSASLALVSAFAIVSVSIAVAVDRARPASTVETESPSAGEQLATDPTGSAALRSLKDGLTAALGAESWPETTPTLDSIVASYKHDHETHKCAVAEYPGVDKCTWGDAAAPTSIVVVGDSTSIAYVAMFRALADASGGRIKVTAMGMYSCPFFDITTDSGDPVLRDACPAHKERAIADIAALKPSFVFITNYYGKYTHKDSGKEISAPEYRTALGNYLQRIEPDTGRIVVVAPPPNDKDVRECYSPRAAPKACVSSVTSRWTLRANLDAKTAAEHGGVFIDSRALFCVSDKCPAFADGLPIKFDATHITDEWSRHIMPAFRGLLAEGGVNLTGDDPAAPSGVGS